MVREAKKPIPSFEERTGRNLGKGKKGSQSASSEPPLKSTTKKSYVDPSLKSCPHCSRNFNQSAAGILSHQ